MSEAAAPKRRGWPRAPIGVQLVILLVASLLVAQAISFGVILLIPPPRPPVYRVADVAAAIHGGPLKPRFGHPMIRTVDKVLPAELVSPHREHERTLVALARTLGAPEARVRLGEQNASPLWRLRRAVTGAPGPRGPDRGGPMGASPFEMDREPFGGPEIGPGPVGAQPPPSSGLDSPNPPGA